MNEVKIIKPVTPKVVRELLDKLEAVGLGADTLIGLLVSNDPRARVLVSLLALFASSKSKLKDHEFDILFKEVGRRRAPAPFLEDFENRIKRSKTQPT